MFGLVFLFLRHSEQGDGKAGQAGAQAPLQETGHHLRAEDWGPEISCEHLQYNACKSGMRGGPTASSTPNGTIVHLPMGFPPQTTVFTTNKPTFYSAAVVNLLCLGGNSWLAS